MYEFQIRKAENGEWYWVFVCTQNGEDMACSETMKNKYDAIEAALSVKYNAAEAPVKVIPES